MLIVAHLSLIVSDIDRSVEFYTTWLGFEEKERSENERLRICTLNRDNMCLELLNYKSESAEQQPGCFDHLAFYSPDLQACSRELLAAGLIEAEPEYRSSPDGRRLFFVAGPDGERLECLDQYPATIHPLEKILNDRIRDFLFAWRRLSEKQSPGRIHDLRVASRRLNVMIVYCQSLQGDAALRRSQRRMKKLFGLLGRLRDSQVELDYLKHADEALLDSRPLITVLEKEEQGLNQKLKRKLAAFDLPAYQNRLRKFQNRLHTAIYGKYNEDVVVERIASRFGDCQQQLAACHALVDREHPSSIHRFRIAAKKVRYSIEALHDYLSLNPADIELLSTIQDKAGQIQDLTSLAHKIEQTENIKAGTRHLMINLLSVHRDQIITELITMLEKAEYAALWNHESCNVI